MQTPLKQKGEEDLKSLLDNFSLLRGSLGGETMHYMSLNSYIPPLIRSVKLHDAIQYFKDIAVDGISSFTLYLDVQTLTTGQGFDVSLLVEDTSAKEAGGFIV